ncbi:MAG: hypothetical protein KA715_10610 [Xanthomonadaceae bacterium]|nr:hypothetical protein [Xanthomonadaceae bacterium]
MNRILTLFVFTLFSIPFPVQALEKVKLRDVQCALGWSEFCEDPVLKAKTVVENKIITETIPPKIESLPIALQTEFLEEIKKNPELQEKINQKVNLMQPFCLSDIVYSDPKLKAQGVELIAKYGDFKWFDANTCKLTAEVAKDLNSKNIPKEVNSKTPEPKANVTKKSGKPDCTTEPDKSNLCECLSNALIHHKSEWKTNFKCYDKGGAFKLTDVLIGYQFLAVSDSALKAKGDLFEKKCDTLGDKSRYSYSGLAPNSPKANCGVQSPVESRASISGRTPKSDSYEIRKAAGVRCTKDPDHYSFPLFTTEGVVCYLKSKRDACVAPPGYDAEIIKEDEKRMNKGVIKTVSVDYCKITDSKSQYITKQEMNSKPSQEITISKENRAFLNEVAKCLGVQISSDKIKNKPSDFAMNWRAYACGNGYQRNKTSKINQVYCSVLTFNLNGKTYDIATGEVVTSNRCD